MAISADMMRADIQSLLIALPPDGTWMPGLGPYSEIISAMLDDPSLLIEEDAMPDDGNGP
jgi:hypothetical protein